MQVKSPEKIIRKCIFCGEDNYKENFKFTYSFLKDVRGKDESFFNLHHWSKKTTSSIVKCNLCGSNYIRDVFTADEYLFEKEATLEKKNKWLERLSNQFVAKNANAHYLQRVVVNLLLREIKNHNRKLKLLDYGASLAEFSIVAKGCGFDKVYAYDSKYLSNIGEFLDNTHPIHIHYIRDIEDVRKHGPYDAIVCRSAIEHFFDPQAEIQTMYEVLAEDGVMYINSVIMDLDRELNLLKNESRVTSKKTLTKLQKSYHIDHLNYIMPKTFRAMLRKSGFREKLFFYYLPALNEHRFSSRNVFRLIKAIVRLIFDFFHLNFRKTNFLLKKV